MTQKQKDKTPVQVLLTPNYILATGKILSYISPFLASRFAAKLFLTPYRYKLPKREKEMDVASDQKRFTIPSMEKEVVVYTYGNFNADRKILLAHGWSGRGTQMAVLAKSLAEEGYQIVSFDAPGHGKAPGKMSMMPYFIETVHFLDKQYGPFEAAVGHSLGGMSLLKAVKDGFKIKKLVIIGTANSVTGITRKFAENLHLNEKVAEKMKIYFDKKFGQDMDNYSAAASAQEVFIPTLVVHDKNDVDVPVKAAYEIDSVLKESELFLTEGLGHRKILGDTEVINKITTFIAV